MKIPDQKPFGRTHDSWSREGVKNKNSDTFRDNYEDVFNNRRKVGGHVKIVYKNGKRYELPNPSTHGESAQRAWDQFNEETGGITYKKLDSL